MASARGRGLASYGHVSDRDPEAALVRALGVIAGSRPDSAIWARVLSEPPVADSVLAFLRTALGLRPAPMWHEALRVIFLPSVSYPIHLIDPEWWEETRDALNTGKGSEADVYAAAWQLIFDGLLYVLGYHEPDADCLREHLGYADEQIAQHQAASAESQALFAQLADLTRSHDEAPLRIAHCIRDLAYGDESRTDDLKAMVDSDDPACRAIFERCYWRPTEEERKREEAEDRAERRGRREPARNRRKK